MLIKDTVNNSDMFYISDLLHFLISIMLCKIFSSINVAKFCKQNIFYYSAYCIARLKRSYFNIVDAAYHSCIYF